VFALADPLIFLFIGAFILSRGIFLQHLDRRVAYAVLALPWVGARPGRILFALGAATAAISGWISNTATTAMMFGIGMSIIATLRNAEGGGAIDDRYPSALMLMISFAASIGGLATPVGTPPNVIGIGFIRSLLGVEIPFFQWLLVGVPVVVVLTPCSTSICAPWAPRGWRRCREVGADPGRAGAARAVDSGPAIGRDRLRGNGIACGTGMRLSPRARAARRTSSSPAGCRKA
jgi:anion transporter